MNLNLRWQRPLNCQIVFLVCNFNQLSRFIAYTENSVGRIQLLTWAVVAPPVLATIAFF